MINRATAPKLSAIEAISFQRPKKTILKTGVEVFSINEGNNKTAQIDFFFNAGSLKSSKIIAQITGDLLLSGTKHKSANEIEESIDRLGGYIDIRVTKERTVLSVFGLKKHIVPITEIVIDAVLNVIFDPKEIKQLLSEKKKRLEVQLQKVAIQARRKLVSELFKSSPYGSLVNPEDFGDVRQKDLIDFHKIYYLSGLLHITVVADLDKAQMKKLGQLASKFLKANVAPYNFNYQYTPTSIHIEKEKAVQTAIRIGRILFNKTHPDFKKFVVLNTILGDYFGSRLMSSLREDKGYTYNIGSSISQFQETGYFLIGSEVAKEFKASALEAIKKEIILLQTEDVQEEELKLVKNYLIGEILEQTDGAPAMMSCFVAVNNYGLDLDYYNKLIQTVQEITAEEIKELAVKYLNWKDLVIVTVG